MADQKIICKCGKRIRFCACGGTACPGWVHVGINEGHYCGYDDTEKASPQDEGKADD